jgi:hypothetical protein
MLTTDHDTNTTLNAALAYAARGWYVIPLRPGGKRPAFPDHTAATCTGRDLRCRTAGVHIGWEQRATINPDRITRAWSIRPAFGIGIACGPSRLVVLDLDVPKPGASPLPPPWAGSGILDGADVLCVLTERASLPLPVDTYTVVTPSGGRHLYFTAPTSGPALANTAGTLGPLIDTRATGGQVVAPPTASSIGLYVVTVDVPPAPLPDWLADAVRPMPRCADGGVAPPRLDTGAGLNDRQAAYARAAVVAETARVLAAQPGRRNHTLFTAAIALGQLVAGGSLDADCVRTVLLNAAAGHLAVGAYSPHQAETTIASGLSRGATRPRGLERPRGAA